MKFKLQAEFTLEITNNSYLKCCCTNIWLLQVNDYKQTDTEQLPMGNNTFMNVPFSLLDTYRVKDFFIHLKNNFLIKIFSCPRKLFFNHLN